MHQSGAANYMRRLPRGSLVDRSLELRRQSTEKAYYFKWSCINLLLLIALRLDILVMDHSCCPSPRYRLVFLGCFFTAFSCLVCFAKYLYLAYKTEPMVGTADQRRLLDGTDAVDTIMELPNPSTFDHKDTILLIDSSYVSRKLPVVRKRKCQMSMPTIPESRTAYREYFLTDPRQLPALMWQAEQERTFLEESWEEPEYRSWASQEMSVRLRTNVYKLSPPPVSNKPVTFAEFGTAHTQRISSHPARFSDSEMKEYVDNLRSWIQTTILKPLVREMDFMNHVIQLRGFVGFEIGTVSRDTLRRTVEGQGILLPLLSTMLAFLNIAGDQRYLVQRIRQLEVSGIKACNSGVRMPTDAAIIFHLFCVYMDTQLAPSLGYGSPFSSRYVIHHDPNLPIEGLIKTVDNYANFAFVITQNKFQRRPRFDYICGGELYKCVDQRGSPFQMIIEFLIHMREHQDSTLEGVSLGRKGINIMSVIGGSTPLFEC